MARRSADTIKTEIEEAILLGQFANGERLDEIRLSSKHQVSRTPIREALRMLAASGLVELIPNRGAFVRFPDIREIVEMFEVMAELESMAARLAATRINAADLARLQKACDDCATAEAANDSAEYYRANERFHHLIYEASGNTFLSTEAARLYRRLQPIRRLQLQANDRLRQSMSEHFAVCAAIGNRQPEQASALLRAHIVIQGTKFNDLLVGYRPPERRQVG